MFAKKEFLDASRKFVCIRIETFESKESEALVRELLNGRFENTSFCIFDPQGNRRLSRTGRSPEQGLSRGRGGPGKKASDDQVVARMNQIAADFTPTGHAEETELQDFDSFRQALNVASADQRLLLFVHSDEKDRVKIEPVLKQVFADSEVVGKFHLDFANTKADKNWGESIEDSNNEPGMTLIRSGQFGIDGAVVQQLDLKSNANQIKKSLLEANEKFSELEKRKSYSTHVKQGRRQRVFFENEIPYGEDKDGDGEVDAKKRGGKKGGKQR